jgi:alcohol dehydrogenase
VQAVTGLSGYFRFRTVDHVLYGPGSVERWRELPSVTGRRAILVTTSSIARSPLFAHVTTVFAPIIAATFKGSRQHAPVSAVQELAEHIAESGADLVLSLGGGSVIDSAKAAIDARAGISGEYLRHIAVPTTLSAAEFAASYGMTDDQTRRKRRGSDARLFPAGVILDANVTVNTPNWLWLGSGLRSVDHAVESVLAPDHNPVADALALEALRVLFRFLPSSVPAGQRIDDRQSCQIGAWLSWAANSTITAGTSHRLGRLIGPIYSIPHGFTSAVLLPHVLEALPPEAESRQALIVMAAGQGLRPEDQVASPEAAECVRALVRKLRLPTRLRDVGVPRRDIPGLAGESATDLRILEAAW